MSEDATTQAAEAEMPRWVRAVQEGRLPRLEWIKINLLRHVEAGAKIVFGSNFNVVLGKNGTGKTTLLEIVAAVMCGNFARFADDEFDVEYSFACMGCRLECQLKRTGKSGDIGDGENAVEFHASLYDGDAVALVVSGDRRGTRIRRGSDGEAAEYSGPDFLPSTVEGKIHSIHAMFLVLREAGKVYEGIAAWLPWVVVRLDEGIETFERLFEHGSRIKDNRALSVVVSKEFGTLLSPNFPVVAAQALHERIIGVSPPPEVIVLGREEMPALGEFIDASQYTGGRLILSWIGAFQRGDLLYAGGNARFELIDGSQISHYQLSFGEKRLLAFLIKLYACPSTIIVDELANGMHHGWIERAVELMDDFGTQAFLTSQDPLLIDGIPLSEDSYPTRNTVVLCEIAESGRLRWRNMTSDEAEDFFESLAVGLQHVSEIMRSKGLW